MSELSDAVSPPRKARKGASNFEGVPNLHDKNENEYNRKHAKTHLKILLNKIFNCSNIKLVKNNDV